MTTALPIIIPYKGILPKIGNNTYIAPTASIIGNVDIGSETGIWFHCVIRGDVEKITIGNRTNIQDGTVIHVTRNGHPTYIGSGVTIGHKCMLHACTIEDNSFIGMGAIIMDDAIIHEGGMVAAGALITPGKKVSYGEIWAGNPAKLFRKMSEDEIRHIKTSEENYVAHVYEYLELSST